MAISINTVRKGNMRILKTIKILANHGFRAEKVEYRSRYCTHDLFGLFDIVAVNQHRVRFIQVKSNAWPSKENAQAMRELPCPSNASKECWRWDDRVRKPRILVYTQGEATEL